MVTLPRAMGYTEARSGLGRAISQSGEQLKIQRQSEEEWAPSDYLTLVTSTSVTVAVHVVTLRSPNPPKFLT